MKKLTTTKKNDFEYRMVRSQLVEKQHGIWEDEQAKNYFMRQGLKTGKRRDYWFECTTFRHVAPFIAEKR